MTIRRDNDFLVDTDLEGSLSVGIESRCLDACVAEVPARAQADILSVLLPNGSAILLRG